MSIMDMLFKTKNVEVKKRYCNECYWGKDGGEKCCHGNNRIYEETHRKKFVGLKDRPENINSDNMCEWYGEGDIPF